MKKLLFAAAGLLFVLIACQTQEEQVSGNEQRFLQRVGKSELSDAITVSKTTNYLTQGIMNMGVEKITVTENLTEVKYELSTLKHFNLNSFDTNYSDFKFRFDGDKLTIDGQSNYSVSMVDKVLYLVSPQYSGKMDVLPTTVELDNNAVILLHFAEEITTPLSSKLIYSMTEVGGCSFWDTYYYYGTGVSSSVAQANLNTAIATIGTSGCTPIGGVDTSCLGTAHLCVSTKAYCCP